MLRITTRRHDDVVILDLNGSLMAGIPSQSLAQHVKQLAGDEAPRVLVRLNDVTCIDSCGVGELISSFTTIKKCGGVLKVCGANDRVGEVLRIVRLGAVVDVYDNEADALRSFAES